MSSADSKGISVAIMGQQHQFACSAEQADDLKQAANRLAVMCENIQKQKGSVSSERALLVASVNLSYSLLMANNQIDDCHAAQIKLISTLKSAL